MFKKFMLAFLVGWLAAPPMLIADSSYRNTITGTGARRDTVEFDFIEASAGSAMDMVPGTDNTNSLGTSSKRFKDVQTYDLTAADDMTVTDDVAINGDTTLGNAAADTVTINATTVAVPTANLYFATSTVPGTNIMTMDGANYRVGVNDETPDRALDVGGTFGFDGNGTFGDAVTDIITFTGLPSLPLHATPDASVVPTAAGQLIVNTATDPDEVCISTGGSAGAWVKLSTPTAACSN